MLPVAVLSACYGGVAMCYVHPVVWMTLTGPIAQATQIGLRFKVTRQGRGGHRTGGGVWHLRLPC